MSGDSPLTVQLVPALPGGVRDFAELLRAQWAGSGNPSQLVELDEAGVAMRPLAGLLLHLAGADPRPVQVLLHFSGYGYQRRGLCGWLLHELQAARQALGSRLRLLTLFHELFAGGPPWRSAFWLRGWQAGIAARLARSSDGLATNSQHHAHWLSGCLDGEPLQALHVRPVFSNIGHAEVAPALALRETGAVVFGSPSTRLRVLHALAPHGAALRALGATHMIEVGSGPATATVQPVLPHHHLGPLPADEVASLLLRQRFALIDYPAVHLAKSGVFAACAAHGSLVLNTAPAGAAADGLRPGQHYLTLGRTLGAAPDGPAQQALASRLHRWYAAHTLPDQAAELLALLSSQPMRTTAASRPSHPQVKPAA